MSETPVRQMWERSIPERILFLVLGTVLGVGGVFALVSRRSDSITRSLVVALVFTAFVLPIGILDACGVPVVSPGDAPTEGRARLARTIRWPWAISFLVVGAVAIFTAG